MIGSPVPLVLKTSPVAFVLSVALSLGQPSQYLRGSALSHRGRPLRSRSPYRNQPTLHRLSYGTAAGTGGVFPSTTAQGGCIIGSRLEGNSSFVRRKRSGSSSEAGRIGKME